jgi:hypothetical protein
VFAIEPNLSPVATEPKQHVSLLLGLDAFGHGDEGKTKADVHYGTDDLTAVPRTGHVLDEAVIDLQLIKGQL